MNLIDIYCCMLILCGVELIVWWYFGIMIFVVEGYFEIIVNYVEMVMFYCVEFLDGDVFWVLWWEIGLFCDVIIGEIVSDWINLLIGVVLGVVWMFEEGLLGYIICLNGSGVVFIDVVQVFVWFDKVDVIVIELDG